MGDCRDSDKDDTIGVRSRLSTASRLSSRSSLSVQEAAVHLQQLKEEHELEKQIQESNRRLKLMRAQHELELAVNIEDEAEGAVV